MKAAGVYDPKVDFHSLRATFITAAFAADIPEHRIQAIVGHSARGVTVGVYRKRVSVKLLQADLERREFPSLDLGHLKD